MIRPTLLISFLFFLVEIREWYRGFKSDCPNGQMSRNKVLKIKKCKPSPCIWKWPNFLFYANTNWPQKFSPSLELWLQVINLYSMVMPASEAPVFVDQVGKNPFVCVDKDGKTRLLLFEDFWQNWFHRLSGSYELVLDFQHLRPRWEQEAIMIFIDFHRFSWFL